MNRINAHTLPTRLASGYARAGRGVGIVHFGIGAFHRAHQAWYTDRAMARAGGEWMIAGVSLRSAAVAQQLVPQDGLYTLVERSAAGSTMAVPGAVATVLVAGADRARIVDLLARPSTHIVSFTVTEKGYCRAADGTLDLALADAGFYPVLAEALARRAMTGGSGLTLISCDNLAANGDQLARLLAQFLAARDPATGEWFAAHCTCPNAMVDRIVPATTDADRAEVAAALGLHDEGVVVTEPFSQWVIEDRFAGPRPAWDAVGAELVADVAPYETAKLRMLNGAHSALAYLGLAAGHGFVHEAVADPAIRPVVERLMRDEAASTIRPAAGQDLAGYAAALLARFANPALNHRLIQIAMDGSQKVPQRWLETLAARARAGLRSPALLQALAAWLRHLRGDHAAAWGPVDDPRAAELAQAWAVHGASDITVALFGPGGLMASAWQPDDADRRAIAAWLD